jgi:tetratricopeptide (TPR) repeat protein
MPRITSSGILVGTRGAVALAALVLATYLPDVRNGFVYDDHEVVLQQAPLRSAGDLLRIFAEPHGLPLSQLPYYRPIPRASLLLQKTLHGDVAAWFHLGNALLMSGVALAALALLRRPALGLSPAAAWFAAAAFALHPVASECVHPIASGRESVMPALFILAALAAWLQGGRRNRRASLLLYALGLASKEQALVVPALVLWADVLRVTPDAPGMTIRPLARRLLPFAAATLLYLIVRAVVVPLGEPGPGENRPFAALAADPLGPLRSLLYLLQMTLAPSAALLYEPPLSVWFSPLRAAAAVATFGVLTASAWRGAQGAHGRRRVLFWLGWLPLAMLPNANLLPLEATYAERYVFVSMLGVVTLAQSGGAWFLTRVAAPRVVRGVVGLIVLAGLGTMTWHRSHFYRDELAFTRQWVASDPTHGNAHASLGAALARLGRNEEALGALREAVRLEPRLASSHYNLGVLLYRQGRRGEAIGALREALRWYPGDADAHLVLGTLLAEGGDRDGGAHHLREALRLRPGWAEAARALEQLDSDSRAGR